MSLMPEETLTEWPDSGDPRDPYVKTDGEGKPVLLSETGWNRAERRAWLRRRKA